jgi:glucosylceramidase
VSRWGWAQNFLVTIDSEAKTFKYNYDYYLMKHFSGFVQPGARRLAAMSWSGYETCWRSPIRTIVLSF